MRARLTAALAAAFALLMPTAAFAQASPSAFTSATRYDELRRVTGTIAPDPDDTGPLHYTALRNTYDDGGRLIRVEKGELSSWQSEAVAPSAWAGFTVFSQTDTTYDVMDRKLKDVVSSGGTPYQVTQYSYDANGQLDCTAVRMNPATWSALPASACTLATTSSTYGPDRITKNVYDAAGQVLKVVKAYGQTTANGLPQLQQDYVTSTYTNDGKQKTLKDANGNLTTYTYDGYDRLVAWAFPSKTATGSSAACTIGTIAEATDGFGNTVAGPSETRTAGDDCEKYAYDRNGNRAKLMKRDGNVIRYAYDALNRNTIKDIPGGTASDVYFAYDARGLQTSALFGSTGGTGITNTYDGFGQLSNTTNNMGFAPLALGYLYDADGNRIRITYPDSTYFTYDYDGLDRATTIKANGASTIATITYDNQGRRLGDTRSGASTAYGYDPVSRLANLSNDLAGTTNDVTSTFAYNPASQIVTKTISNNAYAFTGYVSVSRPYSVNGLNQYTAVASTSYVYDDNGNLTGDGTNTYAYDVENRMVSVIAATGTTTLIYDPLGRLWQQVTPNGGGAAWEFLHDGDDIVERYHYYLTGQSLNTRYVHGPDTDDPLVWYITSSIANPMGLLSDYQASIVSSADAGGNLTGINAYDEYGIPTTTFTGTTPLFGYTGQVWLPGIGLNYYKARMYSPTLGRFMQADPIGYKDQNNLYAYVGNDPVDGRDPSGAQTVPGSQNLTPDDFRALGSFLADHALDIVDAATTVVVIAETVATAGGSALGPDEVELAGERAITSGLRSAASKEEGIVYGRVDANAAGRKPYIGRAKSEVRFEARQSEHARANRNADYKFTELERAKPGRDLRNAEQRQIDRNGGPTNRSNPNGGTENSRNEIKVCPKTGTRIC